MIKRHYRFNIILITINLPLCIEVNINCSLKCYTRVSRDCILNYYKNGLDLKVLVVLLFDIHRARECAQYCSLIWRSYTVRVNGFGGPRESYNRFFEKKKRFTLVLEDCGEVK